MMELKTDPKYLAKMVREYGDKAPIENAALTAHALLQALEERWHHGDAPEIYALAETILARMLKETPL